MGFLELIGFFSALCIGIVLGLMGGGGSILAVPILAYLFGLDEKYATAYSLFIVGTTAIVGAIKHTKDKNVDLKAVLYFGIPAVVAVTLVRAFILPHLPEYLFHVGPYKVSRRMAMFGLFALLMVLTSISILFDKRVKQDATESSTQFNPIIISEGFFIGILTGLVGAGGGFLIVPALMTIGKLNIKKAIGSSLFIIGCNSLIGFFLGDVFQLQIDWKFLIIFVSISLIGMWIGILLIKKINPILLKRIFAFFILGMAFLIFIVEFVLKN